jgi:hypothetical protein
LKSDNPTLTFWELGIYHAHFDMHQICAPRELDLKDHLQGLLLYVHRSKIVMAQACEIAAWDQGEVHIPDVKNE